jgi:hypothetical protein
MLIAMRRDLGGAFNQIFQPDHEPNFSPQVSFDHDSYLASCGALPYPYSAGMNSRKATLCDLGGQHILSRVSGSKVMKTSEAYLQFCIKTGLPRILEEG